MPLTESSYPGGRSAMAGKGVPLALKHEFAWSASRHAGFSKCRRAHYYAYYLSWGGWLRGVSPERADARTQHKLTTMNAVAGTAIHRVLAERMGEVPALRMKEDEAVDRATRALRQAARRPGHQGGAVRGHGARPPGGAARTSPCVAGTVSRC